MAFMPTEELFDNLMKGLAPFEDSSYEESNSDNDSNEDQVSSQTLELPSDGNDLSDKTTSGSSVSVSDGTSNDDEIMPQNQVDAETEEVSCNDNEIETIKESEHRLADKPSETDSGLQETDVDDEQFGIMVDPCTSEPTGEFESVETITIDANQKTQDDEESAINCENDVAAKNPSPCGSGPQLDTNESEDASNIATPATANNILVDSDTNNDKSNDLLSIVKIENDSEHIPSQNLEETAINKQENIKYLKSLKIFSNLTDQGNSLSKNECSSEEKILNCVRYNCRGCDKIFWILRFYYQHIARETTTILYDCKACKKKMKFTNPCLLKIHMKTHGHSIDNIKLGNANLKVKLPPLNDFNLDHLFESSSTTSERNIGTLNSLDGSDNCIECPECHTYVSSLVEHLLFNPNHNGNYDKCPSCLFIFTSKCALKIHKRIHFCGKPYCCPECGMSFVTRNRLFIHLSIECYHYRRCVMTRCLKCNAVFPDLKPLKNHMILMHRTVVYQCPFCPKIFSFVSGFRCHMKLEHRGKVADEKVNVFIKCDMCPPKAKVFSNEDFSGHLSEHVDEKTSTVFGFKCRKCQYLTKNPVTFQNHMAVMKFCRLFEEVAFKRSQPNLVVPVKKRKCEEFSDECIQKRLRGIYSSNKFKSDSPIQECQGSSLDRDDDRSPAAYRTRNNTKMVCLLCDKKFNNSTSIRNHISSYHKCNDHYKYIQVLLDLKESPQKNITSKCSRDIPKKKILRKTSNDSVVTHTEKKSNNKSSSFGCPYCTIESATLEEFRSHVVEHRDDNAYQCLECGECFVCKNPLEIHLVLAHSIKNPSDYISSHYVHNSLPKPCEKPEEEVLPNQCSVCFDMFPDDKALQLHFRSHGMAFLKQNFAKKIST